jgi:hypothetical protein
LGSIRDDLDVGDPHPCVVARAIPTAVQVLHDVYELADTDF